MSGSYLHTRSIKGSMNVGTLTTETRGAGIVGPTQAEVIHPPDLRFQFNSKADADIVKILEGGVQVDGNELAI